MDRPTVQVYERDAAEYARRRPPRHRQRAHQLARLIPPGRPVADLGCGPGGYLQDLPGFVVGLDAAAAMLDLARHQAPPAALVQADLEALPVRGGCLGGAWARNTYVHLPAENLPLALADLHRAMAVGAPLSISLIRAGVLRPSNDDFPGRFFSEWTGESVADVLTGAGFEVQEIDGLVETYSESIWAIAWRRRSLPDTVGREMRILVCGLNPSEVAADAGYGFAGATNRFWRAALAAGLVTRPRDPRQALKVDGVGMTDLVKRATPGAAELEAGEYMEGMERVRRLVRWLPPRVVLFVGLAGFRAAIDRRARPGLQGEPLEGIPVYVMPSTSGLNARTRMDELVHHMRRAVALAS